MLETINQIKDIAEFIGNTENNHLLDSMQASLEKNEYLISVMGQFSAGKSRLINNLLQRDILPVHITETTAVITLIKYGNTEFAEITYDDGYEETITIEESLSLWQSGNTDKLENINAITIYLPCELLRSGLIIADTPGINTIIDKHIELTTEILSSSEKVVYVMGKSVTDTDLKFIEKIQNCGIEMMFVRTHMDSINPDEESIDEAIEKEISVLEKYTNTPAFFVSNDSDNTFFMEIDKLNKYLNKTLAENLQTALEKSCQTKISLIAASLYKELLIQKMSYQKLADGKLQEYSQAKNKISDAMTELDKQIARRTTRSKEECLMAEKEAAESIVNLVKKSETVLNKKLSELNVNIDTDVYELVTRNFVADVYHEIQDRYISCLENIIANGRDEIKNILENNCPDLGFEFYIPDSIEETQEQLYELETVVKKINQYESEIEQADNNIASLNETNQMIHSELQCTLDNRAIVEQELLDFPEYKARYNVIQEASNKSSVVWGRIGSALDWATIFIPGKAITSVAGKAVHGTAKIASKLGASAKVMNKLSKTQNILTKGKKAIKSAQKVDKFLDVAKAAKKMQDDQYEQNTASPLKLLDYLTFEHYFKKIGKHFDKEEILAVDKEYEQEYYAEKSKIENRINNTVRQEMAHRITINKNMSEQQRLEKEKQLYHTKQLEAERELKNIQNRIEKEKKKALHRKICDHYTAAGMEMINNLSNELSEKMHDNLPKYTELYISAENVSIMQKLAAEKCKLEQLEMSFGTSSQEEIQKKIQLFNEYSDFLKKYIQEVI